MIDPQVFMGIAVALLSGLGLVKHSWLLEQTAKGHRLSARFGEARARWIVQVAFVAGIAFGGALASGLINPVRWN